MRTARRPGSSRGRTRRAASWQGPVPGCAATASTHAEGWWRVRAV
jgi:hypothetical protein